MEVRAMAKGVGASASKVRLILNEVRGKRVEEALAFLRYLPSPTARAVAKVVKSASANAENNYQMATADLRIVRIFADEGPALKRTKAAPRGRPHPILKRSSHITVVVAEG